MYERSYKILVKFLGEKYVVVFLGEVLSGFGFSVYLLQYIFYMYLERRWTVGNGL